MPTYKYFQMTDEQGIQVDSAKCDGKGRDIASTYAKIEDIPEGTEEINFNDDSTSATSVTLSNIVVGNIVDGYIRYIPDSLPVITTAPSSANTDGLKVVVLSSEPATKYSGYLYIITE